MWFFKKRPKKDEVLNEAQRILEEHKHKTTKKEKPKCPKCLSNDIVRIIGWNESIRRHSASEKWRGQSLSQYRCHICGNHFYL